jgi:hypothetical protein
MKINGSNLYLIRGDSQCVEISLTLDDGTPYLFVNGDEVKLSVKKTVSDSTYILQKIITTFIENTANIQIEPIDTKSIEYGMYLYDIQIKFATGEVITIVPKSQFWILEEIS